MSTETIESFSIKKLLNRTESMSRGDIFGLSGISIIGILAALLRLGNLNTLGYANHYYAAAVEAMSLNWHNFFFVAAEPGGSVSVDKPPVGLWFQVISTKIFGMNDFALLLPQILAGILSVLLLYYLVKRSFGTTAGLLAALALAITPVAVATDRNNTMDSTLIFTLLLAAWAFIKATETTRLRYLLTGAFLVGVAFNIKMLEAFLPLPAFLALYFLGAHEKMLPKLGKLAGATVLLLVVSASWLTIVDLTPADQRPYVGSSGNNTVINLVIGYNGIDRLMGMGANRGFQVGNPLSGPNNNPPQQGFAPGNFPAGPGATDGQRSFPVNPGGNGQRNPGGFQDGGGRPAGFGGGGGGFMGTGRPGILRLFTSPLNKEVSWILPIGLVGIIALLLSSRLKWPIAPKHQALVLWGGWLLTGVVFFSLAGFFHEYYLYILAIPLAAVAAAGVVELWRLQEKNLWLSLFLMTLVIGDTLVFQVYTANSFVKTIAWLPALYILFGLGMFLLVVGGIIQSWRAWRLAAHPEQTQNSNGLVWNIRRWSTTFGAVCLAASIFLTPGIWSGLTNANSSSNQSLPAAYDGRSTGPGRLGGLMVNSTLLNFLEKNTAGDAYLMAVPSSMQGADYVLATGRPVLYMGGFMGQDQVVTAARLQQLVSQGELRYIYYSANGRGGLRSEQDVSSWVSSTCQLVTGYDTSTGNSGAPDGITSQGGGSNVPGGFGPNMQVSLYDCKAAG